MNSSSGWFQPLKDLLAAVVRYESGQIGLVQIGPPDQRINVKMFVSGCRIVVDCNGLKVDYGPDQVDEAISRYVAEVEGMA